MKGIERRISDLEALEASRVGGFKIRSLADLSTWAAIPEGERGDPDMSEAPDELLRLIVAATAEENESPGS